jgi:hypothetical protein
MKKIVLILLILVVLLLLITSTSYGDTRIMDQKISYCASGEQIKGGVNQHEKVEVMIRILISEEKELAIFSDLEGVVFYLEEDKISDNNSLKMILQPGTHTIRAVGTVPMGPEGKELTLLGCDNFGRYITARIISPYILKNSAHVSIAISGVACAIIASLVVFFTLKGKQRVLKSRFEKKYIENSKKTRMKLKTFLEKTVPNLTVVQRKEAKILMNELGEILKWQ